MRLGILGGSFDPVHLGHIAVAEAAGDTLGLDRVLFVVAALQPLKPDGPRASGEDRFAMVSLAVRGRPGLQASGLELRRSGPSYTVDTLGELKRLHPASTEMFLLLGADALGEFPRWHRAEEIPGLACVVGIPRPGTVLRPAGGPAGRSTRGAGSCWMAVRTPDLSSAAIRAAVARGESLEGRVLEDVEAYIRDRGLYGFPAPEA